MITRTRNTRTTSQFDEELIFPVKKIKPNTLGTQGNTLTRDTQSTQPAKKQMPESFTLRLLNPDSPRTSFKDQIMLFNDSHPFSMDYRCNIEIDGLTFISARHAYVFSFFKCFSAEKILDTDYIIIPIMNTLILSTSPYHESDSEETYTQYFERVQQLDVVEKSVWNMTGMMPKQKLSDEINLAIYRIENSKPCRCDNCISCFVTRKKIDEKFQMGRSVRKQLISAEKQIICNVKILMNKDFFNRYMILFLLYHAGLIDQSINHVTKFFDISFQKAYERFQKKHHDIVFDIYKTKMQRYTVIRSMLVSSYPYVLGADSIQFPYGMTGQKIIVPMTGSTIFNMTYYLDSEGTIKPGFLGEILMKLREIFLVLELK
jgi:hypothetical protein